MQGAWITAKLGQILLLKEALKPMSPRQDYLGIDDVLLGDLPAPPPPPPLHQASCFEVLLLALVYSMWQYWHSTFPCTCTQSVITAVVGAAVITNWALP